MRHNTQIILFAQFLNPLFIKLIFMTLELKHNWNSVIKKKLCNTIMGSRAVDGKRFLESNAYSIPGTYFRLGYVTLRFLESRKLSIRGTFYRLLPLIPIMRIGPCQENVFLALTPKCYITCRSKLIHMDNDISALGIWSYI